MSAVERLSVEIVDQRSGFEALRPQWNELLRDSAANGPFLTWEWLFAWWTHLRERSRLTLFVVRAGEQLVAIAPLRMTRDRLPWFSNLEFLGTGLAGSDYLDLIVRNGFEREAVRELAGAIASQKLALRLSHLPAGSLASRLTQSLEHDGWTCREAPAGVCPTIPLTGQTWDAYLATRGPAHRANVRRRLRALARDFDVCFEPVNSPAARLEALTALALFHNGRWRGPEGSTAFRTPELQAFHRDATELAGTQDWLRLYALHLDGQLAGVMYAFACDRRFYFYQHGFDERYRPYSLGLVLMALTIRAAIDEGADEFDLLYGVESYKGLWSADARPLSRLDLFPSRFAGRLHQRAVEAEAIARLLVRRLRLRAGHVA